MKKVTLFAALTVALAFCVAKSSAQSGGTYEMKQSVVSNGGGDSNGGSFGVTGTSAQSLAGTVSNSGQVEIRGGFWQGAFAPTAATVSVSGRVTTVEGSGIRNAIVSLIGVGEILPKSARTSTFGYFRFDDVEVGQTYILTINSKRFVFGSRVISVTDEITDLVIIAQP